MDTFANDYWAQIWEGDRAQSMANSQPNPHLIGETEGLAPGTALDAGCGAGAEAIWLAARGWKVTAADIASAALDRAAARAVAAGVGGVAWVQADLSVWEPDTSYDLVTTHYAHPSIPQLELYDRISSWVAPGGTLLIVGHLHHGPSGTGSDGHGHGAGHGHDDQHQRGKEHAGNHPPAAASATAAAITERLDPTRWDVETAREVHRNLSSPGGQQVTLHDVVVRATLRT